MMLMSVCKGAGPDSFPTDWPDDNLTENASFLAFVEYAVNQALDPYRSAGAHGGVRVISPTSLHVHNPSHGACTNQQETLALLYMQTATAVDESKGC